MELAALRRVVNLYQERNQTEVVVNLRHPEFHVQNNAIDDQSTLKAYNCTRRAAKSTTVIIDFIESAVKYENTKYLYGALTIGSARDIAWETFKEYSLPYGGKPNESRSEIYFPKTKSRIKLTGFDCSEKQMRKILGQKYKKIAIDEAGSFTIDMQKLIYQMALPTVIDQSGQIILLGTCENIPLTFFQKVTEGKEKGWSIHKWDTSSNPFVRDQWSQMIEMLEKNNPNVRNTTWFKTHYLNQWCIDENLQIIRLHPHSYTNVIPIRKAAYKYILGIDLGYNDATAFSIIAFHQYDRKAYVVKSFKKSGLIFSEISKIIKNLKEKFPIWDMIIDGANKQGVEELRQRFQLTLEPAEKSEKALYLKLLNDDIQSARLTLIEQDNQDLIEEWTALMWEDEKKLDEDPRCQNHLSDATLYAWRACLHYLGTEEPTEIKKDSDEYMEIQLQNELLTQRTSNYD